MMTKVRSGIGHLSDRILARIIPHKTADAIKCSIEACCVFGEGWVPWYGTRQVDQLHGTACTACWTPYLSRC
ncbi:hypothetical protein [Nonomuraea insulae]|uniref:Uncharacterized protein n=1 Tax=Nonomuraea insulae TaxID=1616787 RepID=A0ABW1D0C6_9ACTN